MVSWRSNISLIDLWRGLIYWAAMGRERCTMPSPQTKCHGYNCYILNQLETSSNGLYAFYETLRPLVAPSLRSGCYSLGPSGRIETLDLVSNYYL